MRPLPSDRRAGQRADLLASGLAARVDTARRKDMGAVTISAFGDPDGMEVVDRPAPTPGDGEVMIRTEAIGVGGVDAVIRRGTLGGYGFREGLIPGSEVAGTVTGTGKHVDSSWIGRRAWAFTGTGGGYVEEAVARTEDIV